MATLSLDEKIKQARSLADIPHSQKLVNYSNIEELLLEKVKANPTKDYLIYHAATDFLAKGNDIEFTRTHFSYEDFYKKIGQTINLLQKLGLKKGDRIATISHNHSDTVIQYFAAWTMGLVVVPINVSEDEDRIKYILSFSNSKLAFVRKPYLSKIQNIIPELKDLESIICTGTDAAENPHTKTTQAINNASQKPCKHFSYTEIDELDTNYKLEDQINLDNEALIVFTSGTTGNPKGVVLSQYNLLVDAKHIAEWHQLDSNDRMMCVLPIHHVNGTIVTLITPLYFGGSIVLNDKFRTSTFFKRIAEEKVNVVSVVPTLLSFLLEGDKKSETKLAGGLDLSSFRHIICGAGPLTVELGHEFEDHFNVPIIHGYGLSETTCYSCFIPVAQEKQVHNKWMRDYGFPSIGIPLAANEMAIHDTKGKALTAGERGEIVIRGHNVMIHYHQNEAANQSTFEHGWFRSGDEGFFHTDEDGNPYFFITGRLKELIIRGGVNVSPLEIDEVIMAIPGVKAGIAVGFENNMYGEEVGAYVELEDGSSITEEDIVKACSKELAFHKCPKVIVFGNEIPVTSTGKYQRNKLKPLFAEHKNTQFRKN